MPNEPTDPRTVQDRKPGQLELHRKYRTIGISAVASAAAVMRVASTKHDVKRDVPAILREQAI